MKKFVVKVLVALSIIGLFSLVIFLIRRSGLERSVSCTVVISDVACETNKFGELVFPSSSSGEGLYFNCRVAVQEEFPILLSGRRPSEPLLPGFLKSHPNWRCEEDDVKKAFANLRYVIGGDEVAAVELSTKAVNPALALEVISYIIKRYKSFVDTINRQNEDKALMDVRRRIGLARRHGEDVSRLERELEAAQTAFDRHRLRVYVLRSPSVCDR